MAGPPRPPNAILVEPHMIPMLSKRSLARRRLLASAAALGAGLALPPAALATPVPQSNVLAFSVWRKGDRIGDHRIAFRQDDDRLIVDIDITLQVTFGPVTLYRYSHHNTEIWRGSRLIALDSETHDGGHDFTLSVRESAEGLDVDGWSGRFSAPAETLSSSYWNPDTIYQSRILDAQRGFLMDVDTEWLGREQVLAGGRPTDADRYRITGDLDMEIWYSDPGQWVKLDFFARGSTISYELT